MPLVDYSDSDSEGASQKIDSSTTKPEDRLRTEQQACHRRKHDNFTQDVTSIETANTLPSPPLSFYSLYATNVRANISDDPELHAGRKRQMPHIEGNWPTHIYLECKSASYLRAILTEEL